MSLYKFKHYVYYFLMKIFGSDLMMRIGQRVIKRKGIIFTGHHVLPGLNSDLNNFFSPNRMLEITPDFLEEVIKKVLDENYEIIRIEDVPERMLSKNAKPFAAFTFDDGYIDNIEHALPIFEKYNVPFAIYITSDFIEQKGVVWWKMLEWIIRDTNHLKVNTPLFESTYLDCSSVKTKYQSWDIIYWRLRDFPTETQCEFVRQLARENNLNYPVFGCELVMQKETLKTVAAHPLISIGAHSVKHSALSKLSEEQAFLEMSESKHYLTEILDRSVKAFCYPYGDAGSVGKREAMLAKKAGFTSGVTTRKNLVMSDADVFFLPRVSLNGYHQTPHFLKAMLGGWLLVAWGWFDKA